MSRFTISEALNLHGALVVGLGLLAMSLWAKAATKVFGPAVATVAVPNGLWQVAGWAALAWVLWRYLVWPLRCLIGTVGPVEAWDILVSLVELAVPYAVLAGLLLAGLGYSQSPVINLALVAMLFFGNGWMRARSRDAVRDAMGLRA